MWCQLKTVLEADASKMSGIDPRELCLMPVVLRGYITSRDLSQAERLLLSAF